MNLFNIVYGVYSEVEMAHQVLSKDMAALVEALRLAAHYCRTTLQHDYTK